MEGGLVLLPWVVTHGDLCGGGLGNLLVDFEGRGSVEGDVGDGDGNNRDGGGEDGDEKGGGGRSGGSKGDSGGDRGGKESLRLTGLVDWAEGEWLPFGVGLYGVEELLGRMVEDGEGGRRFEYWPDADRLRAVFWEALVAEVPELVEGSELRARVEKARLLGLLLWYATLGLLFAFDCVFFGLDRDADG